MSFNPSSSSAGAPHPTFLSSHPVDQDYYTCPTCSERFSGYDEISLHLSRLDTQCNEAVNHWVESHLGDGLAGEYSGGVSAEYLAEDDDDGMCIHFAYRTQF